jgi:hypothetical protein
LAFEKNFGFAVQTRQDGPSDEVAQTFWRAGVNILEAWKSRIGAKAIGRE